MTKQQKILRNVVSKHLSHQSAHCAGHSTEFALLKVHQDITEATDKKSMAELVNESALSWIQSYLSNRV